LIAKLNERPFIAMKSSNFMQLQLHEDNPITALDKHLKYA